MDKRWFYSDNGTDQKGPVTEQELQQLNLPPTTLVWSEGMAKWTPLQELAAGQPAPPPMPPPATGRPWFYSTNRQDRIGPLTELELRRLLAARQLPGTTLVWCEGMAQWAAAAGVAALQPDGPAAQSHPAAGLSFAGSYRSSTHNRDLMQAARQALRGRWGIAISVMLINLAINLGLNFLGALPFLGCVTGIASLLISGPLALGLIKFFLALSRADNPEVGLFFDGFKIFGTALAAYLLMALVTLLWLLLFIIPGIIASYRYAMTLYLLADNPDLGPLEAINRSKAMMRGNKWKLFCLGWRFFGWALLALLTCGIGFLWVAPYLQTALAKFYDDLKPAA